MFRLTLAASTLVAMTLVGCSKDHMAAFIAGAMGFDPAAGRLLLFDSDNEFKGCLNCSRYDSDSVCNEYGTYGIRSSSDSIWNIFIFNDLRYGRGLKIVDDDGNFYGYFKTGYGGSTGYSQLLTELVEQLDDRSEIRDAFCG